MRIGKLYPQEVEKLIAGLSKKRGEVLLSGSVGEDCAVVSCEDFILMTSDPITWPTKRVGALSIHISANDVYAGGGEPFAANITLIAPPNAGVEELHAVMADAEETAKRLNIDIVGGHTEFSDCVTRTITAVTMLGRTKKPVYTRSVKSGDLLFMTKYAGYEGTAILAGTKRQELLAKMSAEELDFAEGLMDGISVREEAEILRGFDVSAMHDITEGGVLGAAAEMCAGKEKLNLASIPVLSVTKKLCAGLGLDPLTLIGSGSMLAAAPKETAKKAVEALLKNNINAVVIGQVSLTSL